MVIDQLTYTVISKKQTTKGIKNENRKKKTV